MSLFNLKSVNPQPESGSVAKNMMGKIQPFRGPFLNARGLLAGVKRKRKSYASGSHLKRCIKEGPTPTATRA
eukprot:283878-Pelagomonas_calceolata.AAC.1